MRYAALVLVPVGLRNQAIGGRFMLTTSQAGSNFYIGNPSGADDPQRAATPLRRALELDPDHAEAARLLGMTR